ncbi:MAG: SRPBCC domain-containing protein [Rhodovibrionaceae bacterium]
MHDYDVRRSIAAAPAVVWSILTDTAALQDGSFGILKIDGQIGPGARISILSEVSPKRAFPVKVVELVPERLMVWQGGMPFGLFKGVRRFELREEPGGTTFRMYEDFSGPLAPMIRKSMPDLTATFDKFADALKARAEAR